MSNKITCACGISYRAKDKSRHEKSKHHLNYNVNPVEETI